jgi:hypothetical protein
MAQLRPWSAHAPRHPRGLDPRPRHPTHPDGRSARWRRGRRHDPLARQSRRLRDPRGGGHARRADGRAHHPGVARRRLRRAGERRRSGPFAARHRQLGCADFGRFLQRQRRLDDRGPRDRRGDRAARRARPRRRPRRDGGAGDPRGKRTRHRRPGRRRPGAAPRDRGARRGPAFHRFGSEDGPFVPFRRRRGGRHRGARSVALADRLGVREGLSKRGPGTRRPCAGGRPTRCFTNSSSHSRPSTACSAS